MTAHVLRTRRMILNDMGKAGLAVLVMGTAACADSSEGDPSTTRASGDDPASSEPVPTSTVQSDTTSPAEDGSTGPDWHRVDLGFVSAYILYRSGEAALVDTGVSDSESAIEAALTEVGLGWNSIGHVIVTHKHPDHQGSLEAVLARTSDASWYAGEGDMAAINAATSGVVIADGESVFDMEIIETPGHTPGHISVLEPTGGVLVAGDALNGADGGVVGANPDFSEDMSLANASIEKLAGFDYQVILFGHGEPVLEGGSSAVSDLAATLG